MDEGVHKQLIKLCELHIGTHRTPQVAQPKYSRNEKLKIVRTKAWNVLFSFLNGPHRKQSGRQNTKTPLSEIDQINALVFELRQHRKYDDANYLDEQLQKLVEGGISATVKTVLQLLIKLSDVNNENEDAVVGHCARKLPIIFPRKTLPRILPPGPLSYGDTCLARKDDPFYTHFPSKIFEVPGVSYDDLEKSVYDLPDLTIFYMEPGKNLCGHGVFNIKGNLEDAYEKGTRHSLFGALTNSLTSTNDVILDLPDLNDTWNSHILELKTPNVIELSTEDEGFVDRTPSTEGSIDSTNSVLYDSGICESRGEDIWDLALKQPLCHHHTWELRGRFAQPTEKPYLTEAGIDVFDRLHVRYHKQLRLLDPGIADDPLKKVSMYNIVKDTLSMLIGVPSETFLFEGDHFNLLPNVYVPGLTPSSLSTTLKNLMICGSQYVKLVKFSTPPVIDSMYQAGLVFQAFTGAVRKYLQHYRACVLSIPKTKTLLQLITLLEKLTDQMRVLTQLCWCDREKEEEKNLNFPTGVGLLSYLYDNTLESSASCHYPMLLSLLHTSCGPYIVFVREWVFYGNCQDLYGEFLIQVNDDFLRFRDRSYWVHGYEHVAKNLDESVPLFLKDMANEIFVCGKAINLMRLIYPNHFIFSLEREIPSVSMTFSETELASIQRQVQVYVGRMKEIARQHARNRADILAEEERAKQAVLVQARKTAQEQVAKYQARVEQLKKKVDEKKRSEFAALKEQMEKDLRRRATEKEQEKEEDAARSAMNTRQELLEAAVEDEIAQKAREELVEEYAAMTALAAARESKALWKVARHRLEARRIQFLTTDEAKWQAELFENPMVSVFDDDDLDEAVKMVSETDQGDEADGSAGHDGVDESLQVAMPGTESLADVLGQDGSPNLPQWAIQNPETTTGMTGEPEGSESTSPVDEQQSDEVSTGHGQDQEPIYKPSVKMSKQMSASKQSEPGLPKWASKGKDTSSTVFGLDVVDEKMMPSWARDKSGNSKAGLIEVDGSDSNQEVEEGTGDQTIRPTDESQGSKVKQVHVSQETDMSTLEHRSAIKIASSMSATTETKLEWDAVPRKKLVAEKYVNIQTTEKEKSKSTRGNSAMSSTQQSSAETDIVPRKKLVHGQYVGQQSEAVQRKPLIKINQKYHPSIQSHAVLSKQPQRSVYGHPSQMSMISNYEIIVAKVKPQQPEINFIDFSCYQIKPRRNTVNRDRPDGAMSTGMYATKESEYVDFDKKRLDKFKALNVHGHSSDSSVQRLLYGENFGRGKLVKAESIHETHEDYDVEPWTEIQLEEYDTDFRMLNKQPVVDLMNSMLSGAFTDWNDYGISTSSDISAYSYVSLSALLKRAVVAPLSAQIQIVNQSLVDYYFSELQIESHFIALRRFLLMEDGEFGQSLSEQLFEKLALCPLPHEIFNPMFLNNVLSRALRSCLHGDSEWASNVGFAFQYIPPVLEPHAPKALDCLHLTYNVEWPVNVIITTCALSKYSRVFSFMLQLKRAVWVLKDVWHRLKRDAIINNASTSPQFRKLQLYRHEMQHFVKVMQGYIANQVIHVTWQEFKDDLSNKTHSIDDLHSCHTDYLTKCINRCLLNKKAAPVMKIIEEIFEVILKFRTHLISFEWHDDDEDGITHPAYDNMCNTYKVFKDYARFLFKVVNRLALRGYQPHLQELLLRLNYNSYYSNQ